MTEDCWRRVSEKNERIIETSVIQHPDYLQPTSKHAIEYPSSFNDMFDTFSKFRHP